MNRRKLLITFILLVVVSALLATSAAAKKSPLDQEMAIWELSKTQVVAPGEEVQMAEGLLIKGIALEAKAKTKSGKLPDGVFELTFDAFQPAEDMGSQKAGWWYITGNWTITRHGVEKDASKAHSPDSLGGHILTALPFNPMAEPKNWSARAAVPMSSIMGQWGKGEGSLTFNAASEGDLFLELTMWPEAK